MKRQFALLVVLILSLAFVITSCGGENALSDDSSVQSGGQSNSDHTHTEETIPEKSPTCTEKGLAEGKRCSTCGEILVAQREVEATGHDEVMLEAVEPTDTMDGLTEGKHCLKCGEILLEQEIVPALLQETDIKITTMNINNENAYLAVPNSTETFSFLNNVCVAKNASFVVSRDIGCEQVINSKTVSLNIGDNVFYILVTNGKMQKLYTVTLRRIPMYRVSFLENGGTTVVDLSVEEGNFITEPVIMRAGYTFSGWDYDFSKPVMSNITIKAFWVANTDTPYRVEHYLQNIDDDNYTRIDSETEYLTGTTDTYVIAKEKQFANFETSSIDRGRIDGNGFLVLRVYYTRKTFSLSTDSPNYGSITNLGSHKYNSTVTATAKAYCGYEFLGWYSGQKMLSADTTYTFVVQNDVVAKFKIKPEMSNFIFDSTITECNISGIIDSSATEIIVPDYVTSISRGAFKSCNQLISITLPFVGTSTTAKSQEAHFGSIFGFTRYPLGFEDEYLDYEYFIPTSLTEVIITGSIAINSYAFCSTAYTSVSLSSITIPKTVASIGRYAFYGCRISQVHYGGTSEEWEKITIDYGNDNLINAVKYYDGEL